jgi:hypothetical protein
MSVSEKFPPLSLESIKLFPLRFQLGREERRHRESLPRATSQLREILTAVTLSDRERVKQEPMPTWIDAACDAHESPLVERVRSFILSVADDDDDTENAMSPAGGHVSHARARTKQRRGKMKKLRAVAGANTRRIWIRRAISPAEARANKSSTLPSTDHKVVGFLVMRPCATSLGDRPAARGEGGREGERGRR